MGPSEEDITIDLLDGCDIHLKNFLKNVYVYNNGCCCHQIQPVMRGEEQIPRVK